MSPWTVQKAQILRRAAHESSAATMLHKVAHIALNDPGVVVKSQVSASPLLTWLESLDASVPEAPVRLLSALLSGEQGWPPSSYKT